MRPAPGFTLQSPGVKSDLILGSTCHDPRGRSTSNSRKHHYDTSTRLTSPRRPATAP